jgi:hypothetical protein
MRSFTDTLAVFIYNIILDSGEEFGGISKKQLHKLFKKPEILIKPFTQCFSINVIFNNHKIPLPHPAFNL